MVGCVGNAPTLVQLDIRFTGGSRSLRGLTTRSWLRDVELHHDAKAYEAPLVLNLPAIDLKLVDRHGFAPCSHACKASDLLNDRAAQDEIDSGGGNRTRAWTAYEAVALPLGDPAV